MEVFWMDTLYFQKVLNAVLLNQIELYMQKDFEKALEYVKNIKLIVTTTLTIKQPKKFLLQTKSSDTFFFVKTF